MAGTIFVIVSTVLVLIVGSIPSISADCYKKLEKCPNQPTGSGMCRFYSDLQTCMENALVNCTDDQQITAISNNMRHASLRATKCTESGKWECFDSHLRGCEEIAPYWQKFQISNVEGGKKIHCGSFKSKAPAAKACVKELEGKCSHPDVNPAIETSVKKLEDMEKLCADY